MLDTLNLYRIEQKLQILKEKTINILNFTEMIVFFYQQLKCSGSKKIKQKSSFFNCQVDQVVFTLKLISELMFKISRATFY